MKLKFKSKIKISAGILFSYQVVDGIQICVASNTNLVKISGNGKDSFYEVVLFFTLLVVLFLLYIIFRNSRKLKKSQQELSTAKEKNKKLEDVKHQLMAIMSHEIRTPINSILGFANLLSRSQLNEKQLKHVLALKVSGINLHSIIEDILLFSKLEAGLVKIEKESFL